METYADPPSVASTCSTSLGGKQKNPVLKIEREKNGKIEVHAGKKIWDAMPVDLKEDIEIHLSMETDGRNNMNGDRMFAEVKEFCNKKDDVTVKEMRKMIPKSVLVIFHSDLVGEGREKVRDMWTKEHRPRKWPSDPGYPFVDPNNGGKLPKAALLRVHSFLKGHFNAEEATIRAKLGLDTLHKVLSPRCQKVKVHLCRAQRDITHVLRSVQLNVTQKSNLEYLKEFIQGIIINDDNVLSVFDVASAVLRLMLEIEIGESQGNVINSACEQIRDKFQINRPALSTVQPSSKDVGQHYMKDVGAILSPTMNGTELVGHSSQFDSSCSSGVSLKDQNLKFEEDQQLDSGPGYNVQSFASNSIEPLGWNHRTGTPQLEPQLNIDGGWAVDILAHICNNMDIDSEVPSKKKKTGFDDPNYPSTGNSEMGITKQSLVEDTKQFQELASNPVFQQVIDSLQQQIHYKNNLEIKDVKTSEEPVGIGTTGYYNLGWIPGEAPATTVTSVSGAISSFDDKGEDNMDID